MNWLRKKLLGFLFKEAILLELQDNDALHVLNTSQAETYVKKRLPFSDRLRCKIRF